MNIVIITGGSRGIGKALVEKFVAENYKVYSISRSPISIKNSIHIPIDLSNPNANLEEIFQNISFENATSITLLNNAGRLGTIGTIETIGIQDINKTMQLNTTAPIILSSLFLKYTAHFNCKKKILNISSGAAVKPYAGWSVYCAGKAALDMLTKTIALEQDYKNSNVKCMAIYPGVVDTDMQKQIRKTPKKDFDEVDRFISLKKNKELFTPKEVADKLITLIAEDKLPNGAIYDLRDASF